MPLKIHFLDVGHGDCTIIEHPSGNLTMIDINNGSLLPATSSNEIVNALSGLGKYKPLPSNALTGLLNSSPSIPHSSHFLEALLGLGGNQTFSGQGTNPLEYLSKHYPNRSVFRYIQSHPDLDHMRGLGALFRSAHRPVNFWDTYHNKVPDLQERDKDDWSMYKAIREGALKDVAVVRPMAGHQAQYYNLDAHGQPGGDAIQILAPTTFTAQIANQRQNWNELSFVLRIIHAGRIVILAGDAGDCTWENLHSIYGTKLRCDILKASHHGRDSGYYQEAVKAMNPWLTIASVGKKPDTDASAKYRRYSEHVWSTRHRGNITVVINDDGSIDTAPERW